jgi:YD repeat-containing protein
VTTTAALTGTYGLRVNVTSATAQYVQDNSPSAEARYRARFLFNPNAIAMASGNTHVIFQGYSNTGATTAVVRVELQCASAACSSSGSGLYQIRVSAVNTGTTWLSTSWYTVTKNATSKIEFDWKAASTANGTDGYVTLWLNGTQRQNLTGIPNGSRRVETVRLGMIQDRDTGTTGPYFFDGFESRRVSYIGAAPSYELGWASKPLYKLADERPGWSPSAAGPAAPAADIGSTVLITTTIAYTYDPLGRLTAARYSDGRSFEYTYDSTGNRLSETQPTGTITCTVRV